MSGELFKYKNTHFCDFLGHLGVIMLGFRDFKTTKMAILSDFPKKSKKNVKKIKTSKNEQKTPKTYAIWHRLTIRTNISSMRHFEATYFDF